MSINSAIIIGNLGQDPELRQTKSGSNVCGLRIGVNRPPREDGTEYTDWINVSVFGKQGETCYKHLTVGSRVAVEGRIEYRQWDEDDKKREAHEIRAYRVDFLNIKPKSDSSSGFSPDNEEDPFG